MALRLYVGNLPYAAQGEEIEKLFADNDIPIKKVDISIDPFNGRSPGYCFVDFDSEEHAETALQKLPGQLIRHRPIKINYKTDRRDPPADRLPTKTYDQGWKAKEIPTRSVGSDAYAYDRWSRDDAASRWTAPPDEGRRIYVGGLPQIRNQDTLNVETRELFRDWNVEAVSKILSPAASTRQTPGSHHYCFVDLPTAEDADAAIAALNGTRTPAGGQYRISRARMSQKPRKVDREQLGMHGKMRQARSNSPQPDRDFSGSWRRGD